MSGDTLFMFPFLTLLVLGGHILLLLAIDLWTFCILTTMLDESIGRAFNKVSQMLTLPWSVHGPGTALEQFCAARTPPGTSKDGHTNAPHVLLPMRGRLAFLYTSLHLTTMECFLHVRNGVVDEQTKYALACAFQKAAVAQLEEKLALGLQKCQHQGVEIWHVVVSGGVASNSFLRERYHRAHDTKDTVLV
ncbi:hypothetical protein AcV7_004189 [Taiwanofungus camphoratus]|nr:hypothetical protein AcV7_004189 [Antrodia cinnamomea]